MIQPVIQNDNPQQAQNSSPQPSIRLLRCGIPLVVVSSLLFFLCFWTISINARYYLNYGTIFSCLYHIALSAIVSIVCGDIVKYRRQVIVCMGLAIFGVAVITLILLLFNYYAWENSKLVCYQCYSLHLQVTLLVCLQGIIDIIITIIIGQEIYLWCGGYSGQPYNTPTAHSQCNTPTVHFLYNQPIACPQYSQIIPPPPYYESTVPPPYTPSTIPSARFINL